MKSIDELTAGTRAKAQDAADRALTAAQETAEAARLRIQQGYGRARETAHDLSVKGREQADHLAQQTARAVEKGKAGAARANDKLRDVAEEQPIALVAGALALGALIGSLLPKRSD